MGCLRRYSGEHLLAERFDFAFIVGIDIDVFFLEIAGLFIVTIGYGIFRFTLVHGAVHQYIAGNIRIKCFVRPYGTGQTGILLVAVRIGLLGGPVFPFVDHGRRYRASSPTGAEGITVFVGIVVGRR